MSGLFEEEMMANVSAKRPLAVKMRPTKLDDIVGQDEAIGENSYLRRAIKKDMLASIILYGPAGTGKTTIAKVIANTLSANFVEVSAVSGSVSDLRKAINEAAKQLAMEERQTILFVDEIHRFSKSQQDALLAAVEDRTVILIGATTENPLFEVNTALLSRCRIVELHSISIDDIQKLVRRALASSDGLNNEYMADDDAIYEIAVMSGGDARSALTTLELSCVMCDDNHITYEDVIAANPRAYRPYDADGDEHYDIISAFIKSMRGSDPDATLYWLARMIDGGEDPKFIARRILICASEDVGLADSNALLIAEAAFKATEVIGYPECRINLAHAAVYVAQAPKSNTAYLGIDAALDEVRHGPLRHVPNHLRDRHRPGSESYGKYIYPHDYSGGYVVQQYLPDGLEKGCFYHKGPRDK